MNVLDLFSGIGGFSLGLERAGMRTIAFCEIDLYCRKILAKHWPDVPIFGDVREFTAKTLANTNSSGRDIHRSEEQEAANEYAAVGTYKTQRIDLICGGFPCQDISLAGKGAGIEGSRSGLWSEYARIIGEIRPRYVIVENVAALLGRGLSRVLGDLAALGYDAEWHCIPASAIGAPHRRDRVWIVAYSQLSQDARQRPHGGKILPEQEPVGFGSSSHIVADTDQQGSQGQLGKQIEQGAARIIGGRQSWDSSWWSIEPNVGGNFDGFPRWLHRFVGWGMTYDESARSVETLRQLWNADVAQTVWQTIGGFDRFFQAQILFAIVRQYEKNPDETRLLLASAETLENYVRGLRGKQATSRPSHRSKQSQQPSDEYSDIMQVVPQFPSCNGKTPWNRDSWEDGIPRVAKGVQNRVDRLRSLGNAIVPQIAEIIGRAIMELEAA